MNKAVGGPFLRKRIAKSGGGGHKEGTGRGAKDILEKNKQACPPDQGQINSQCGAICRH